MMYFRLKACNSEDVLYNFLLLLMVMFNARSSLVPRLLSDNVNTNSSVDGEWRSQDSSGLN